MSHGSCLDVQKPPRYYTNLRHGILGILNILNWPEVMLPVTPLRLPSAITRSPVTYGTLDGLTE